MLNNSLCYIIKNWNADQLKYALKNIKRELCLETKQLIKTNVTTIIYRNDKFYGS